MAKKIHINDDADPSAVLAVVAQTADQLGFTLEQTGPSSATAHDGRTKVSGDVAATRARVGITVEPGTVKLKSETTGAAFAAAGGGFVNARINWRYSKFAKHTKKALAQAGLA